MQPENPSQALSEKGRAIAAATLGFALIASLLTSACSKKTEKLTAEQILARHRQSLGIGLGLSPAEAFPKLLWTLEAKVGAQQFETQILVRGQPFGFLETKRLRGQSRVLQRVSDGRYVWSRVGIGAQGIGVQGLGAQGLGGFGHAGPPLPAGPARACLERAFYFGFLYLDRERFRHRMGVDKPGPLARFPHQPSTLPSGQPVQRLHYRTRAGSTLQLHFDASDGRLLAITDHEITKKWIRFTDWKRFGKLWIPSSRLLGRFDREGIKTLRVLDLRIPQGPVSDANFAGCPIPKTPRLQDAGKLRLLREGLETSARLLLYGARLNGQPLRPVVIDTGASYSFLTKELGDARELPNATRHAIQTMARIEFSRSDWIDRLDFGARTALQFVAPEGQAVPTFALPREEQPRFTLGGEEFFSDSPILDFARGKLFYRGEPVQDLAMLEAYQGHEVIELPFQRERKGVGPVRLTLRHGERSVEALLDSGFPSMFHLTRPALAALGLPLTRRAWLDRGAKLVSIMGAHGEIRGTLVLRFGSFWLGPMHFKQPVLSIEDPEGPGLENTISSGGIQNAARSYSALVGAGVYRYLRALGINWRRRVLEFQPGDRLHRVGKTWESR